MSTTPATDIRDAAYTRLVGTQVGGKPFTKTQKAPITRLQVEQLPLLAVFIASDREDQRGNVTYPQFTNEVTIGISIVFSDLDPVALEGAMDDWTENAKQTLLGDPTFAIMYEYVTRTEREYQLMHDAEIYGLECRLKITVTLPTEYPPDLPNPLTQVQVTYKEPSGTPTPGVTINLPQS